MNLFVLNKSTSCVLSRVQLIVDTHNLLVVINSNYTLVHPQEKGNTPLHVAAKAGQLLQAELLTVYGADPGAPDSSGNTPIDYARSAVFTTFKRQFALKDQITRFCLSVRINKLWFNSAFKKRKKKKTFSRSLFTFCSSGVVLFMVV